MQSSQELGLILHRSATDPHFTPPLLFARWGADQPFGTFTTDCLGSSPQTDITLVWIPCFPGCEAMKAFSYTPYKNRASDTQRMHVPPCRPKTAWKTNLKDN